MNSRRIFLVILAVGLLTAPLAAGAQQPAKIPRIGYLSSGGPSISSPLFTAAFQESLRELGYVEGQNILIEYRWAEGRADRLPALAAELVHRKVDLLFAISTPAALAAKDATTTIPIVFAAVGDPVGTGIVANLARPGGNITGVGNIFVEISAKVLELLEEAVPGVKRVAVLGVLSNPAMQLGRKEMEAGASTLGVQLQFLDLRGPNDFTSAFAAITKDRGHGLIVFPDSLMFAHRSQIVDFAAKHRLPAMYPAREFADAGGLMSYGTNYPDMWRRWAIYVDKILKGAKPADLPVEQPTRFELVINMKTAKALGLSIPQSILIRADQVIQ